MPRKEERISYLKEVELEFASGRRSARISDISPGGCYVDTIAQVPVGEILSLHIAASDGESIAFKCKVAYVLDGNGFGVEFVDVSEQQGAFLTKIFTSSAG